MGAAIAISVAGALLGFLVWLFAREPDEVTSSVVYQRLDMLVPAIGSDAHYDAAILELKLLRSKAADMEDAKARKAYLYWIPHFIRRAEHWKEMNASVRRTRAAKDVVPRP